MKAYAKHKIVGQQVSSGCVNPDFAHLFDEKTEKYSGRRIFRIKNRWKIRAIMDAAHFPGNFITKK